MGKKSKDWKGKKVVIVIASEGSNDVRRGVLLDTDTINDILSEVDLETQAVIIGPDHLWGDDDESSEPA